MKLFITTLLLWMLANMLDIWSTIIQSPESEENPFMRHIWQTHGTSGFIITSLFFWIMVHLLYTITHQKSKAISISLIILSSFKILIALTNFGIAPYYLTAWFQY